ncbi:MAG: Dam family site-specific DNA-(adenine-N6)-methyltransferase [Leptolyngbyaceae cyanobacterium bins.349]|nr:Dam family site-specific DNA-(adenine-N6)-methyltransferase [Leptolyngbyaceae cyanobacterium bins.349]
MPTVVPPIKCQGIKTKLIPMIQFVVGHSIQGRWIEPFCGSGVVAFNIKPKTAILADTNEHIIYFYQAIQTGLITPEIVSQYLKQEGEKLLTEGEQYYYDVRDRFNTHQHLLDFLFLNRAGFNGMLRYNRKGHLNVPFCRKPQRFAKAYITKIVNQVRVVQDIIQAHEWTFQVADFSTTLAAVEAHDLVYVDPPYSGRHVDYFNTWTNQNEQDLIAQLKQLPCDFILSTWKENQFRANSMFAENWQQSELQIIPVEHFYHLGAATTLRHAMTEALVTNRKVE